MIYLVVIYRTYLDDSECVQTIFSFDNYNEAIIKYHREIADSRSDENCKSVLVSVMSDNGSVMANEFYTADVNVGDE